MARVVSTKDEFRHWLVHELTIPVVVYFVGDMAGFRKKAARSRAALGRKKRPDLADAHQIDKLARTIALCDEAQWQARIQNVHLHQKRGGSGWVYFARRTNSVNLKRRP